MHFMFTVSYQGRGLDLDLDLNFYLISWTTILIIKHCIIYFEA